MPSIRDLNKLKPVKTYKLSDKEVNQAIADYIVKHSEETYLQGGDLKLQYLNGEVPEKPLYTHIIVEVGGDR